MPEHIQVYWHGVGGATIMHLDKPKSIWTDAHLVSDMCMPKATPSTAKTGKRNASSPPEVPQSRIAKLMADALSKDEAVLKEISQHILKKSDGTSNQAPGAERTSDDEQPSEQSIEEDLTSVTTDNNEGSTSTGSRTIPRPTALTYPSGSFSPNLAEYSPLENGSSFHDHYDHKFHEHSNNTDDHDHDHHNHKQSDHELHEGHEYCLEASTMLSLISTDPEGGIKGEFFKDLCPLLISQIETDACHMLHNDDGHQYHEKGNDDHNHDHNHEGHNHDEDHNHGESLAPSVSLAQIPAKVWGFSCIAVVIISLVGLLGVAVIPVMQKVFYNHLLQILVALAVGALAGDALLHLLPHAMAGGHEGEKGHDHSSHGNVESRAHDLGPIYKGLCGLLGIFFFFIIERVFTIVTETKRKKQKREYMKVPKDDEEHVGERVATTDMCDAMLISIQPKSGYKDDADSEHCRISFENSPSVTHEHTVTEHNLTERETNVDGDENATIIHDGNDAYKHSDGHGHSHVANGIPTSVTAVAMMVIMGDGVHNFCDGLAIGAAFASSIAGGFSTTIAVFCHELPHEIGDFAMLLRAGMSVKQAVFYNCVSSILCFIGMVVGVAIGNIEGASMWIFTVVAGMFLYISLVDMLPEVSSVENKKGENPFFNLLLQFLGMFLGGGIMFVIAIYEDDLKTLLE
ncbi:zinc transporter ZIP10-like [Dreissena polymorpha]|uniref:zinc transporter ZIP10-like n=1 Tax=Dreissena polymorpha TaxID=45954 RepID=UPI0022654049|nr:zinc transporter ZIP10-like [Dreissena polymorpha]